MWTKSFWLRVFVFFVILTLLFGCNSNDKKGVLEPEDPSKVCLVEVTMVDSNPPSWQTMDDIYVSHTSLDTGEYYLGHIWWLRRLPDEYKISFLIEENKDIFITARHYYGYNIYPLGSAGASLMLVSDWNVVSPSDTTNGLQVKSKTRFYSGFWRTEEFDALGRPVWKDWDNDHIFRIKDVDNGKALVENFSKQRAVYFLESSYEVKTFRCVRSGTTRLKSTTGTMFRRVDFQEPLGVLSPASKVPSVTVKTQMYQSTSEARSAFLDQIR